MGTSRVIDELTAKRSLWLLVRLRSNQRHLFRWIRLGNERKAAIRAREVAHDANILLARGFKAGDL